MGVGTPFLLIRDGGRRAATANSTNEAGINGLPGHRVLRGRTVPRLHTQHSLVNRILPQALADGKWAQAGGQVLAHVHRGGESAPKPESLHLMLFKPFGVASDQLRSVMVSSREGRQETSHTEPKGKTRPHGASSVPCFLAQMPSSLGKRILTC